MFLDDFQYDFIVINVNFKLNIIWIIINMIDMKRAHVNFPFHIHVGRWGKEVRQLLKQEINLAGKTYFNMESMFE
jgi:hypothetical protein